MKSWLKAGLASALLSFVVGSHSCAPADCTVNNCSGCCDLANICHPGTEQSYCGHMAQACVSCAPDPCNPNGTCFGTSQPPIDDFDADVPYFTDGGDDDGGADDAGGVDGGASDGGASDGGASDGGASDAGASDAGASDGGSTDAGVADAGPVATDFYVSPTGSDTDPGTLSQPFKTIAHALSLIDGGVTNIKLLDGRYDLTTQPAAGVYGYSVPAGTTLSSVNPGQATVTELGYVVFNFAGSGGLTDLVFDSCAVCFIARGGRMAVTRTSFLNCGYDQGAMQFTGTVQAELVPAMALTPYTQGTSGAMVRVDQDAGLVIKGGVFEGVRALATSGLAIINVVGNSTAELRGVTFRNNTPNSFVTPVVSVGPGATVRVFDSRFLDENAAVTHIYFPQVNTGLEPPGNALVSNTLFQGQGAAVGANPFTSPKANVTLDSVTIAGDGGGRYGVEARSFSVWSLVMRNSTVTGHGGGVEIPQGTLVMLNSTVTDNTGNGVSMPYADAPPAAPNVVVIRNSTVTRNQGAGVWLTGSSSAYFDLGNPLDAGNNTLGGNRGQASLMAYGGAFVNAQGNRWTPGVQGASADGGLYSALPDGGPLEFVTGTLGGNVEVNAGRVRVAE